MTMELRSDLVVPHCPHCDGDAMGEAPITLEQLIDAWPLPEFVPIGSDGCVAAKRADEQLVIHCPDCRKPSALSIDSCVIKLVPARTATDERPLGVAP